MSYPNLTADRKFKLKSTSTEYTLKPPSLTTTLCSPQPTINFRSKTAFVWCSQRFDTRNNRLGIDTRIVPQPIMPGTILRCDPHARMHRKPPLWPRPCITAAISLLSSPRHSNSPSTRYSTSACTRSTQASFTCAPRKTSACRPGATTPSSMYKCKCTCAFSVAPKRCTHSTPPLRAAFAVLVLARAVAPCTALIAIAATRYRQHASTAAVHSGRRTLG